MGKFLQGIFLLIAVKYPDDRREESATWSTERSEGEVEKKSYIKGGAQYIIRIKGQKGTCFNYPVVTIETFIKHLLLLSTMADKIPTDALKVAGALSRESGVPLDDILQAHHVKAGEVAEKRKSDSGKFKVLGIDKFDGEDWVHGEYGTAKEALEEARKMTREAMGSASDSSIATVYYAYDPSGKYLGGDTWNNE